MTTSDQVDNTPPSASLPADPLDQFDETLSKWPTVLGTASIVFASLGLICYGCGTINSVLAPVLVGMMPEDQRPASTGGVLAIIQVTQLCLAWLLSVWLMVTGIGLVRRRTWARGSHIWWAFTKLAVAVLSTIVGIIFIQEAVQQVNDQLGRSGSPPFLMTAPLMMIIMIASLFWQLIYPIFLILWFSREKIRNEVAIWI